MSRRKQLRPRHVQPADFCLNTFTEDASLGPAVDRWALVCSRCCAEFSALSDLEQHQRGCSPNPPVLIVNEDEDLLSGSKISPASLPTSPAGEPGEMLFEMENVNTSHDRSYESAEFVDCFSSRRSHRGAESSGSASSHRSVSAPDWRADAALCTSAFPQSSPRPGRSAERGGCPWTKSNVIVESLESAEAAVAQLSQLTRSDSCRRKTTISSLLQQLLALQIQQIHQLQLIEQIRHQVLLFASQQAEIPETLVIYAKDLPCSKSTDQLKSLGVHLSQQLAAAAGVAKCLSAQSAHITDFKHFTASEKLNKGQPDFSKSTITAVNEHVSKKQHMGCGSSDSRFNFFSQTKMSSLMFSNNSFTSKTSESSHLPQPSSSDELAASSSIPNISEIVEDLDALAALAHQRKCNNLQLSAPTPPSRESFFKVKCRFCTKVFGSDGALKIHLLSHAGERPHKCNICGNRFSTRGSLKVHFQRHKEKYPNVQLNPYLVPEHLDNVQTGAGIPFVMSLLPEKAAAGWFDGSASTTTTTSGSLEQSDSTNLPPLIKTEEDLVSVPTPLAQGDLCFNSAASMDFRSKVNPAKTPESVETRKQRTMNIKSEDVKPSFNIVSTVTSKPEESISLVPNPLTPPGSTSFSGFLSSKHSSSKLLLPSAIADKRSSDPNECVICHRTLSCQSALRMHFRTHTGERPYQCKLCGRAFTTKGNLKTHQAVHRAAVPLRVQHSCPICQRKFTNAVVFQQHVHMHVDGHLPGADFTAGKYSGDCNEGFRDKAEVSHRKNFSDDNNFCDVRFPPLKSLSIRLSSPSFGKHLIDANKKASYRGPHGQLQLKWIKTERPEGSNEECSQTNNQRAAESGQRTFPMSDSSASDRSLSPHGQASVYFKPAGFDEPLHTWLDSTTLTLQTSAAAPTRLTLFNHSEDSPSLIHNLREKGFLKSTYCDLCGKNFACQSALDIHYRSHTKERPFICSTCSRGFSTKGNLKQHMLTHRMRDFPPHLFEPFNPSQEPNPNVSRLCVGSRAVKTESTAFLNSSVSRSLSSSASESRVCAAAPPRRMPKQHHCKTCGKSFSSSSALQIHERTHTGERPFACAVCGRAFTTKGNLKVHMGTHMWNSAPSRRGRRLSADRPPAGAGTRPVKLPEPSQKNLAVVSGSGESVCSRSPAGLKVNDVGVVRVDVRPSPQDT